jgi:hypothetical protein
MAPKNKKLKLYENFYLKLKYSRELGNFNLVLTFLNTKWLSFNFETIHRQARITDLFLLKFLFYSNYLFNIENHIN